MVGGKYIIWSWWVYICTNTLPQFSKGCLNQQLIMIFNSNFMPLVELLKIFVKKDINQV